MSGWVGLALGAVLVGLLLGAYALGYADGRLTERAEQTFARMDRAIRRIRP